MSMTWLADVDKTTFWGHHPWPNFGASVFDDHALAILPVFGFGDHGLGLSFDAEEVLGSVVLKRAIERVKSSIHVRVLPPLRFVLAPYPSGLFGVDPETAYDLLMEISEGVKAAGFQKLAFFNTSPWNQELADTVSRDVRIHHSIQTFVANLSGLGLNFHPASEDRARTQAAVAKLLGETPRPDGGTSAVSDVNFRPGNFRSPPPLPPGPPLDGAAFTQNAAERLAGLILEMVARPPLTGGTTRTGLALSPVEDVSPANDAPIFPQGFRGRYLPALRRDEWARLTDVSKAWVIVPTASIEQHGPHLPVGVDSLLGHAWVANTIGRFPAGAQVYVAPPITYGKSNEHIGFPGTLSISAKLLRRVLLAIASQLKAAGFRQIAILNSHGGNTAVLVYTLREIQTSLGMRAGLLGQPYKPELSAQEAELGFHAGEWETSLMLAIADDLVHMEKAVSEYPAKLDEMGSLKLDNGPAYRSWITADISESGVMGDAKSASQEKGLRWLEAGSSALAQKLATLD